MKTLSKFLLIGFSVLLAVSGYLSSKAQDARVQKEEAVYFLIARIGVLNSFYSIGKYQNEAHSLANYRKMLDDQTSELTAKIESYNPKIIAYGNWATALLFVSIVGNTVILVIEQVTDKRKRTAEPDGPANGTQPIRSE